MLTGKFGLTIIIILLLEAGLLDMHVVSDEVSTHVTVSMFIGEYVKVEEFVPV